LVSFHHNYPFFLVVQGEGESVPGPAEASGEAKAGSQHLRDVEELRFDFVLLDHLMF